MSGEAIDVSEMLAVHDAMRREYASLPLLVKSIADGDAARADIVAEHVILLGRFMDLHHAGEDELLWPLVQARTAEAESLSEVEDEHRRLDDSLARVAALVGAWRHDPSLTNRAALHTELIALERALLGHLSREESEMLPLVARALTSEEFAALGAYVRQGLDPEQRSIVLGMILDDTGDVRGDSLLNAVGAHDREEYERNGRARHRAYRSRLLDGWG